MARVVMMLAVVVAVIVGGCSRPVPSSAPPVREAHGAGGIVSTTTVQEPGPTVSPGSALVRRVTYLSRSAIRDSATHVTATIFVPPGTPPQGGFPIVGYGRAVGGMSPDCAFSSPEAMETSSATIDALLKAGYIVAVPDYQGLGNPPVDAHSYHPYLDSTTAGYNLIDAVQAARELVPDASPYWVAVGDVQGGQGAWAVNELADNYSHASLVGTVSISPTADVDGLADGAAQGTLNPEQQRLYIAYLAALAAEYGGEFHLDEYRRGEVQQNWNLLLSCQPSDDAARSAVSARIGPDDLRPASPAALTALRAYLRKTTLPQGPTQQPMLVVFGDQDPLTPSDWTTGALVRACNMGDSITIREEPAPTLDSAVLGWVADRLAGIPAPSDCSSFTEAHPLSAPASAPAEAPPATSASPPPFGGPAAAAPHRDGGGVSLISGWLPTTIQAVAVLALIAAAGWRSRRWRLRSLPLALAMGVPLIGATWWFVDMKGWGSGLPWGLWLWVGCSGVAVAVLVLGWPKSPWWRRAVSILAVPLCVVSAATVLNASLGYLPTAGIAWQRMSGQQPPQWIDQTKLLTMQRDGERPTRGTVVSVRTPSAVSGFAHRDELVYLPPAWFSSNPPPQLPTVMMFGPEFSSPGDWLQSAGALDILDRFALQHRGVAPVVVFPDISGSFMNDTECVNGPRGNASDHLTKEVVPYMVSTFGVSAEASAWGLAGWSSGGTCSVMLAVTHPDLFSTIVDLDGQLGPNAGTKQQTISRLFGGDADAWAAFDPRTAVLARGNFNDMAAWIGVSESIETTHRPSRDGPPQSDSSSDWDTRSEEYGNTGDQLCQLLSEHGIECSVVGYRGGHNYPSAANGFTAALPWLAGRLGTPGVRPTPLPGTW